jgi:hypothetical protein
LELFLIRAALLCLLCVLQKVNFLVQGLADALQAANKFDEAVGVMQVGCCLACPLHRPCARAACAWCVNLPVSCEPVRSLRCRGFARQADRAQRVLKAGTDDAADFADLGLCTMLMSLGR